MIRLAVRAARADAPALLAELLVFSPAGLEEVDIDDETVEYAIYGAPGALPSAAELAANSDVALLAVHTSEVADDWSERWREFHQPTVVSERLYVRPARRARARRRRPRLAARSRLRLGRAGDRRREARLEPGHGTRP